MTDNDVDEALKKNWIDVLNPYNSELINQQMERFVNFATPSKTGQTEKNHVYLLRYQGKFYFIMGIYEQALINLTKVLEFDTNDSFALRYRAETYYIIKKYEESLVDLNKLLEINPNEVWALKVYKEVIKR